MAKGSNNIRGRSSDASKPYDVSNSFVKRVASRVTELLPQPSSWLSRWMSPSEVSNANEYVGHSLSSTITSRPPATSRAELNLVDNVDHHAPAAKKPRTNRYNSPMNQKFLRNDQYNAEDISPIAVRGGEPIAGPSSRDTRPELIASTPAVPGQQMAAKVNGENGDDCSETSESTSGCSSLVPQAQSSTRSLGGSRYGRSIPGGSSLDALDRRRPSFNTTTFNSPLRASMRARLGSSPFYSGRTMYGGSSAACDYAQLVETSRQSQASRARRVGPTVRPPPGQDAGLPLSTTAKRILDALEQFSTPMIDAKKMPVVGAKRSFHSMAADQSQPQRRYAELNIPSTPDLLRVKRRERLQRSTLDARETAAQTATAPASVHAEYSIRKEEPDRKKHTGKVKTKEKLEEEETVVEVKLPQAVLTVENLPKIDIAIPPPPAALSVSKNPSIPAAQTGIKFVFSQPTIVTSEVAPVSVPTSTFKFSEPIGGITSISNVCAPESDKLSSFSASLKSRTSTGEVSGNFTLGKEEDRNKNAFTVDVRPVSSQKTHTAGTSVESNSSSSSKYLGSGANDEAVSTTQKWECSKCKNNNSSSLEICLTCKTNKNSNSIDISKNNIKSSVPSGFDSFYKKPVGTWECSTCLIQNKGEATKCVACESSKPVAKEKTVKKDSSSDEKPGVILKVSSEEKPAGTGFGDLFKKPSGSWTCDVCMINNNSDKVKCAACETPKPGATVPKVTETVGAGSFDTKQTGNGFGNLFKKPSGSWSCDVCMINNDADKVKCAACETPKPGATIPKATETSGPTFSFGIPPAVSTNSSGVGATFSFGIPKGNQTSSTVNTSLSVPKSTTSSDSAPTPTPTFSFGIPKPAATESNSTNVVTSSTSAKPTIQFGSSSVQASVQETKSPFASAPATTNIFGNLSKKSTLETSKPTETNKLAFSISTSTPSTPIKPTAVFGVTSEKTSLEPAKTGSTPTLFAFGSNKVTQNEAKTSSDTSTSKPTQPTFMFGSKQDGYGSNLPSSTTNTLSSSSPSNVFKFGDTKTVSSGSGATSISSVSTQASTMTPKASSTMFSFGSNSDKKVITFGRTEKETPAPSIGTSGTENKPIFGAFGATASTPSTFGSGNTFGSSTSGSKEQTTSFTTQSTTNTFGATATNTSTSTFSTFGQTNAFQPPQQENKPSPVFAFGASAPQKEPAPASGGFVFNPVFPSGQTQQNTSSQLFGFGNTTTASAAPSSNFNFEPKFGSAAPSPFNASASAPTPIFGAQSSQQAPAFGEQATTAPMFNFGSQSASQQQTPANPVFEFGSNQQQSAPAAPAPAPTFMFGAAPAAPTPAPANPPAFDPNIKPTFNFTQGTATPVFSAIPTVNSTGPAQPQNRKIRKAVRRTNISSVRN